MLPGRDKIEELSKLCRLAGTQLAEMAESFEKLKAAIEKEGHQVIWHMHSNEYSLRKIDN